MKTSNVVRSVGQLCSYLVTYHIMFRLVYAKNNSEIKAINSVCIKRLNKNMTAFAKRGLIRAITNI